MIQQINLYQDSIRQGQTGTPLGIYSAGILGIILLLSAISIYLLWDLGSLKTRLEQTRQRLTIEQTRVNELLSKFPRRDNSALQISEINRLQNRIGELSQTLQLLTDTKTGATKGFSQYFQALANQSIPEIWLSRIYISRTQRIIDLEGSTFKFGRIPYFLQQLQKEPVFHGQTFAKLAMLKSEKIPEQIDFSLNTTVDPPKQQ